MFLVLFQTLLATSAAHAASVSSTPAQTFHAIGGSGAWWPTDIYNFPESVRQNLSDLLFSPSGMQLSSYRWNVGAGGVNVSNPVRAIETFYVSDGQYDWSKDASGIYFLKAAAERDVPYLTMFANSAPAPMTADKTSCASHFVDGSGAQFGEFLADVAQHWIDEGIPLNYVSPINEPDSDFGPSPCGQEGMLVQPYQRSEVVSTLYAALENHGLEQTVGILADESSSLSRASSEYADWLPDVVDKVAALVHHTYDFPSDASYVSYVNTTKNTYGKATWMSEVCCSMGSADGTGRGWSGGYDPTIVGGLMWVGMAFQSFNVANEAHYDFWTLVSNGLGCDPLNNPSCATTTNTNGWNDGVIFYDDDYASNGNYELYLTKHFWTYKHLGNFVRPGSVRLPIDGLSTASNMAVRSQDGSTYYILAMNTNQSGATTVSLTFPDNVEATSAFRTSETEDFSEVALATESNGAWSMNLPALSLTTFVFKKT
ncbi:glycoside hydrolase family 30 protein [Cylindrobasidium torrendii FP15055 ss-10]|uniref:Glycoside hydrolase family 30 protein n=1 Tax=Cylindrobasidium torrendii FP15055 ss-10 TaxID=1314674 RepID=A0A0D7BL56_9AGAR|nr:glycoside hydrolase family 30 protein [Cylindrobasidium torrendii FP15055 ss-10]